MWTQEQRARQLSFERCRRCPTDLADAECEQDGPLLPKPPRRGRTPGVDLREALNAIRHMALRRRLAPAAGALRAVADGALVVSPSGAPHAVPDGHDVTLMLDREQAGREASPTADVVDSQAVKAPHVPGEGGYDAAKRTKGRKRHAAVDTNGRLLMVNLATADVQDAAGADEAVRAVRKRWPWLRRLFADGAHDRGRLASLAAYEDFTLEVVRKLPEQKGFQALPRRWVVERTFGWMTRWRTLVRDYEKRLDVSGAIIHLSMGALLFRRVAHPDT